MIDHQDGTQRPCLALMGEFSAGKSTLANLLIGSDPLPVQVVATQLPPVVISYGDKPPVSVDLQGQRREIDLANLNGVAMDQIAYIHIHCVEDLLRQCDLMDMPGISDPNMSSQVWERMIGKADGVLWCSHATQAWRQSEAAVWRDLAPELAQKSLLLLTRIDKLQSTHDRDRVIARVRKETVGLFRDVMPISLLLATREQEDYAAWSQSGAEEFAAALVRLLQDLGGERPTAAPQLAGLSGPQAPIPRPQMTMQHAQAPAPTGRVIPRRVRPQSGQSPRSSE